MLNNIYLKNHVQFVNSRLVGEKNGRKTGITLNIVVKNAGETKQQWFSMV
jgi:hypothetical protein